MDNQLAAFEKLFETYSRKLSKKGIDAVPVFNRVEFAKHRSFCVEFRHKSFNAVYMDAANEPLRLEGSAETVVKGLEQLFESFNPETHDPHLIGK